MTSQHPLSLPSLDAALVPIHDGFARSPGKCYYSSWRIKAINILPDDVLLEIFDLSQRESIDHVTSRRPGSNWLKLVHVCRRWRQIVLASPRRLELILFCTFGTPVRKNLGFLPAFPIIVDYLTSSEPDLRSPAPNHEDDIIAALEHPDRVRSIKLALTSSLLEVVAPVMLQPFLALTTLWLASKDHNAPVLPNVFLGGIAPHLRQIFLEGISFPALPTLLLSANNLVDFQLKGIPQSAYISPEVMVTSLAPLNRLESIDIWFKAPISRHQLRHSPSLTRHVLLSLVTFNFRGSSEYLEHLLAQIDTPRLRVIDITYFHRLDFQIPQLSQFIRRTEHLELAQSRHSHGRIRISSLAVELDFQEYGHHGSHLTLRISCKWLDWQVLHLAQILGQLPAMLSNVNHLSIDENDLQHESGWNDSMDDANWLELLHQFTAMTNLHGSKQLAGHIALALDSVSGESTTDVLPALASLSLEDQPVKSVERFLAVRQNSGHPVTFVGQVDLLVDGFIARTFPPGDANRYLCLLLRVSPSNILQHYGISHHQGAWYITYNINEVQGSSPGVPVQPTPLLDYSTRAIHGIVVPQMRWSPADEVDVRRFIYPGTMQLPIFFVARNGRLGISLPDILRGCDRDLRNAYDFAPLGGKTTTRIRIDWPGYKCWKRQIPTREETHARNPITMARFMKHIGTSLNKFFRECMSDDYVATDRRWQIGEAGRIKQEDVIIIGAINVSAGSWMPILQLNRHEL